MPITDLRDPIGSNHSYNKQESIMTSKDIYTSLEGRTPYTYYIKWKAFGISYYGSSYSKKCHPSKLWKSYFTSSKYVKEFRKTHGEPDIIKITKIFDNIESCREWENTFLIKTKACKNNKMLNRSNPGAYGKSLFKPSKLPGNAGANALVNDIINQMCLTLNIPNIKYPTGNKGRFWVNYKHIIKIYFLSQEERLEFLTYNPAWSSGRTTKEQKEKLSIGNKGKSKPLRTKQHCENISKSTKGKTSIGSGPKGKLRYHNYEIEIYVSIEDIVPIGFIKGRLPDKYGNKNFGLEMIELKNSIKRVR